MTLSPDGNGGLTITQVDSISRLNLPIYTDATANPSQTIVFPLRDVRIEGTMTPDQNCVGSYDPSKLEESNNCQPDPQHGVYAYKTTGTMTGHIYLYDADEIVEPLIKESLCVLLSGDDTTYGDGQDPPHCKKSGNTIVFYGDWCDQTDSMSTPTCFNSVQFQVNFAASAVLLSDPPSP